MSVVPATLPSSSSPAAAQATDPPSLALDDAAALIAAGQCFLSTAHANVDGDALGAMLVTAHGLRALGKQVHLYNQDLPNKRLRFLPGAGDVKRKPPGGVRFDATLVHDTGARHLLGERFPAPAVTGPLIVLDHHALATPFGDIEARDPAAASSGVMAWRLLTRLGLSEPTMPTEVAVALLASLVEDTGWFRYENTNPEALHLASVCVARGAVPWDLSLALDESNSEAGLRLLSLVLASLERHFDGRLAILTMDEQMLRQAGASPEDVGKFVNYARSLRSVEVAAFLTLGDKSIYVSLRGKGSVDVAAIALRFGGGGHRSAAGALLATPDPDSRTAAKAKLIAAVAEALGG